MRVINLCDKHLKEDEFSLSTKVTKT